MIKRLSVAGGTFFFMVASASALPLSQSPIPDAFVRAGATDCRGPIASEKHPIVGEKLTGTLRREGRLPDQFVCGHCRYDLRGDPGAAYYIKACR